MSIFLIYCTELIKYACANWPVSKDCYYMQHTTAVAPSALTTEEWKNPAFALSQNTLRENTLPEKPSHSLPPL